MLYGNARWRVNIEISGSGLEFLQSNYPDQLRLLRMLVERGQVELLSALYTPGIWIAFPRRDLEKSIELNRRCLEKLGFPWTRIFFAQEAFFGAGVQALTDHFDVAICKDDYLSYFYGDDLAYPHFRMGQMRVVIASGHIVKDITARCLGTHGARECGLSYAHQQYLAQVRELNQESNFPACRLQLPDMRCYWYHCGDGNHFGCTAKPDDPEHAYYDPAWSQVVCNTVGRLEDEGYELATIGEFVNATATVEPRNLPPLVEGAWNPRTADGVFCWMGRNSTPAEDDAAVLTAISRARRRLIQAGRICPSSVPHPGCRERLERAWTLLLHAQISDSLGWFANSYAVANALRNADQALTLSTQVIEHHGGDLSPYQPVVTASLSDASNWPVIEIFGGSGSGAYEAVAQDIVVFDVIFTVQDPYCGTRMPFLCDEELVFCPAGTENEPIHVPLQQLKPDLITLPLANGLLEIGGGLFVIKDTAFVHVAARVNRVTKTLEFAIQGARLNKSYHWRFFFTSIDLVSAVKLANQINFS